jgi:hypothetical protein
LRTAIIWLKSRRRTLGRSSRLSIDFNWFNDTFLLYYSITHLFIIYPSVFRKMIIVCKSQAAAPGTTSSLFLEWQILLNGDCIRLQLDEHWLIISSRGWVGLNWGNILHVRLIVCSCLNHLDIVAHLSLLFRWITLIFYIRTRQLIQIAPSFWSTIKE